VITKRDERLAVHRVRREKPETEIGRNESAPLTMQLFLTIALANARNDPPPTPEKLWLPPGLSKYEDELAQRSFSAAESGFNVSINPRKVYNLAELIDIAERTNPETRVASSTLMIRIDFAMALRRSLSMASASANFSNGMGLLWIPVSQN
jgi:hypothetical protein